MRLIEPWLRAALVAATLAATGCAHGVAVPGTPVAQAPASQPPPAAVEVVSGTSTSSGSAADSARVRADDRAPAATPAPIATSAQVPTSAPAALVEGSAAWDSAGAVSDRPGAAAVHDTLVAGSGVPWPPPIGHDEPARSIVGAAPESLAALRSGLGRIDYLWVVRTALVQPASVDSMVERARRIGVRGLLVQVVGRGDAWYRSDLLPRAEALSSAPSDYDPLARVLERAHAAGLEVHAWMNCMLVWSAPRPPRDSRHVVNAHPEWIAMLADGRRMSRLSPRTLDRMGVEGTYLAPAHPRVRQWVASIAAEIASRYPVDGVHLDYIRCPDVETGFDPNTRARFALAHGVDPQRITFAPSSVRWKLTQQFREFQRQQVTAVVREVRDSLLSRRPEVPLSAAVVADTGRASGLTAQSWREWMRDGLLDRVYPMCYSPDVQRVMSQLLLFRRELGADARVVPGIAVYNTSPATAAVKIKGARALGYPLLALYSYDSLFAEDGRWSLLERGLESTSERGP
jgi:uncharacterized lipoprotein YddW (UPF0748 family)